MSESENEIDKNIFLMSDTLLSPEDIAMHLTHFDPNVNRYTDSLTDSFPNGSQVYLVNNEIRKQKDKTFSKVIYKIKDQVSPVLVHYLGDNSKFSAPKHGNSTVSDKPYLLNKRG
jgi:hypothetical protein